MGLATRNSEAGRADLVILDAERLAGRPGRDGALADACPGPGPRLVGAGVADADAA